MAHFSSTAYTKSHTNVAPRFSTTAILFPNGRQEFHKRIRATAPHTHSWKAHALSDYCPPLGCEGGFTWVHKPSTANSDKSRQIEFFAPKNVFLFLCFYVLRTPQVQLPVLYRVSKLGRICDQFCSQSRHTVTTFFFYTEVCFI